MSVVPIVKGPDKRLHMVCEPFNHETDQQVIADLKDTLESRKKSALGISAPQLGYMKRAFIIAIDGQPHIFCNPVILMKSNVEWTRHEGCLSFPHLNGVKVTRPMAIQGTAQSATGGERCLDLEGLVARVFLHEFDHLNGITIETYRRLKQNLPLK